MLWHTNVNPTFNKGTLKKCWDLEWEVGRGGGDDVEKVGRTSGKILATPMRVSFRNGEKRLFFVPEGSVITHRTSFELLSKILRNLCETGRIHWVPRQWMEVAIFGWSSVDRFQYTSTTELNCEPWNAFPFVSCSVMFTERCQCVFHQRKRFA